MDIVECRGPEGKLNETTIRQKERHQEPSQPNAKWTQTETVYRRKDSDQQTLLHTTGSVYYNYKTDYNRTSE